MPIITDYWIGFSHGFGSMAATVLLSLIGGVIVGAWLDRRAGQ